MSLNVGAEGRRNVRENAISFELRKLCDSGRIQTTCEGGPMQGELRPRTIAGCKTFIEAQLCSHEGVSRH